MNLKIGSLFSGIGGLDLAVEEFFDAHTAWHCEWDEEPSKVLAARWPGVPNHRDVRTVDWAAVEPVDIMCGGFPCQDVSLAGRRAGMKEGTRSGLWSEFARAIDIVRPKVVVIENVRGLLSADAGKGISSDEYHCGVCGWSGRWGGVHRDSLSPTSGRAEVLQRADHSRDDGASSTGPGRDPSGMGRLSDEEPRGDRAVGRGVGMEPAGPRSRRRLSAADAVPAGEAATGGDRDRDGGVQGVASDPSRRASAVVGGRGSDVRDVQGSGSRAQQAWPACPECGGDLSGAGSNVEPCPWCMGDGADEYHLRALDAVVADLSDLGFDAEWTGLRAADVGAPHGRFRFFLLAYARDFRHERPWPSRDRGPRLADSCRRVDAPLTLLPTPVAQPSGNTPEEHLRKKPGREVVTDLAILVENGLLATGGRLLPTPVTEPDTGNGHARNLGKEVRLLPTPRAARGASGTETMYRLGAERDDTGDRQGNVTLMPTPQVADATGGHASRSGERSDELLLPGLARELAVNWGDYEPAVRLWESLTRPAPAPTLPDGKNGNHRLAAVFPEWMMGYSAGWVTDILRRNPAIKACGNGVVPQQAYAALGVLWARVLGWVVAS